MRHLNEEGVGAATGTTSIVGTGIRGRLVPIRGSILSIAVAVAILAVVPIWTGDSRTLMGIAIEGLLFACYAVAFNIIFGSTGQLFLCMGALAGIGGYGSAIISDRLGVPIVLSMALAAAISGVVGGAFSWIAVRRSLDVIFTGIVTLAFSLGFASLLLGQRDLTGGENGLVVVAGEETLLRQQIPPYYVFLALLFVYLVIYLVLHRSHMGWAFAALRDEEVAAELAGIDVARYRIYAGLIGSAMLGFAGALLAHTEGFIGPSTFAFTHVDVRTLVILAFGGIGTLLGPVIGSAVFTVVDEIFASFIQLRVIMYGTLLLVLFLFFQGGVIRGVLTGVRRVRGPPTPAD